MAADPPLAPRRAATVLLLRDDPFEVLMLRRRTGGAFSGALVFPGGAVDPSDADPAWLPLLAGDEDDADERALRIAACRETFEEAGILIGAAPPPPVAGEPFHATVARSGGRLAIGDLVHYAHWITPADRPRRFDTHFFLCPMPPGQHAVADGVEAVALEWVSAAVSAPAADSTMLFPTRLNLRRLAESASVADALAAARARPRFTVSPVAVRRGAEVIVTIPAEAGYGVTEDRQ